MGWARGRRRPWRSTTAAVAPPPPPPAALPPQGMWDRGNKADATGTRIPPTTALSGDGGGNYRLLIRGSIIRVAASELWTGGNYSTITTNNRVQAFIDRVRAEDPGRHIWIRPILGSYAPDELKAAAGTFTLPDGGAGVPPGMTYVNWASPVTQDAYRLMVRSIEARWPPAQYPEIIGVSGFLTTLDFAEIMIRKSQVGAANRAEYARVGITFAGTDPNWSGTDWDAMKYTVQVHAEELTYRSGFALSAYERVDTGIASANATRDFARYARGLLPGCVLSNYALGRAGAPYQAWYDIFNELGPPVVLQTAVETALEAKAGNTLTGSNWETNIRTAIETYGCNAVELIDDHPGDNGMRYASDHPNTTTTRVRYPIEAGADGYGNTASVGLRALDTLARANPTGV